MERPPRPPRPPRQRRREEDDDGKNGPLERNPDADPVRIHEEYVERYLGGGAPATPEAFERATRQWHELPGAVLKPATELSEEERPAAREHEPPEDGDPTGEPPA